MTTPTTTQARAAARKAEQDEARRAYIDRVVAEAPPLAEQQLREIAALLRPYVGRDQ